MIAVLKASQAISSELSWERVTQRLLELALEQSGANYGCLLFKRDGSLFVAASARAEASAVTTHRVDLAPLEAMPIVPQSVVHFVLEREVRSSSTTQRRTAGTRTTRTFRTNDPAPSCVCRS